MLIAQTDRTEIFTLCLEDAAFFLQLLNTPEWLRFIGDRKVHDRSQAKAYLENGFLRVQEELGFSYYLVRNKSGEPLGTCGFLKKPNLKNVDFGFAFLPEFHGRGYGFESGRAVLDYGIRQYGFEELDAVTVPENAASIGLLEKLGFEREGLVEDSEEELLLYRWVGGSMPFSRNGSERR